MTEEQLKKIKDLWDLEEIKSGIEFAELTHIINAPITVIEDITKIYTETLYKKNNATFKEHSEQAIAKLKDELITQYATKCSEKKELLGLPELEEIIDWVMDIHLDIVRQLFTDDMINEVMTPAYQNIKEAILEAIEEEMNQEREASDDN